MIPYYVANSTDSLFFQGPRLGIRSVIGRCRAIGKNAPADAVNSQHRVSYCNQAGKALLMRNDMIYDEDGLLICRDRESDLNLTIAIRELGLVPISTHGAELLTASPRNKLHNHWA